MCFVNFEFKGISDRITASVYAAAAIQRMADRDSNTDKKFSTDWLMRGVLTKVGDAFDRLTGRGYRPSSSLATSELIEKLKKLLDHEVRDGKFVPHNIKLKMQWDKFSTDSDDALQRLENELKIAIIDHINDRRYHTYAPIRLQVKPDYFTDGVKLLVSFDKFDEEEREVALNVTVPQVQVGDYVPEVDAEAPAEPRPRHFTAAFTVKGKSRAIELEIAGHRRLSVGRGPENDLVIDDASVSKMHASLVVNAAGNLAVADTGSTNGTFVAGNRIAYGKAVEIGPDGVIKFGTIGVRFESTDEPEPEPVPEIPQAAATEVLSFRAEEIIVKPIGEDPVPRPAVSDGIGETAPRPDESSIGADPEPDPLGASRTTRDEDSADPTADRIVFDFDEK